MRTGATTASDTPESMARMESSAETPGIFDRLAAPPIEGLEDTPRLAFRNGKVFQKGLISAKDVILLNMVINKDVGK